MNPRIIDSSLDYLFQFNPVLNKSTRLNNTRLNNTRIKKQLTQDVCEFVNENINPKKNIQKQKIDIRSLLGFELPFEPQKPKRTNDYLSYLDAFLDPIEKKSRSRTNLKINPVYHEERHVKTAKVRPDIFYENIEKLSFKQGKLGTCYLLSALYALAHNPNPVAQKILKNCVHKKLDGSYYIMFNGLQKGSKVSINELDDIVQSHGDKGIQVMEAAYGKLRKTMDPKLKNKTALDAASYGLPEKFLKELTGLDTLKITSNTTYEKYKSGFTFSGKIRKLNEDLLIAKQKKDTHSIKILEKQIEDNKKRCMKVKLLLDDVSDNPGDYAMTAVSKMSSNGVVNDSKIYTVDNIMFYQDHAYAIKCVDKKNKMLTIVNPHDTDKEIQISYSTFLRAFSEIAGLKLPKQLN